jgi:hypothetical protein
MRSAVREGYPPDTTQCLATIMNIQHQNFLEPSKTSQTQRQCLPCRTTEIIVMSMVKAWSEDGRPAPRIPGRTIQSGIILKTLTNCHALSLRDSAQLFTTTN